MNSHARASRRGAVPGAITIALALVIGGDLVGPAGASAPGRTPPAGESVRQAQRVLRHLGYAPGPVDGILGRRTRRALTQYQRAQNIAVTARLDTETKVRLDIDERVLRHGRSSP
jgi:peptidoglycan hydrolase-like protein with peptidoglycan-binding domain